jgi:hypothetical protein
MVGVRVVLTDLGTRQRELLVRIETRDTDGDRPLYQASIAGNPGIEQRLWMYMRVPMNLRAGDPIDLLVYEAVQDDDVQAWEDPTGRRLRAGRLLARVPVTPARVLEPYDGVIGVVGQQPNPSLSLYSVAQSTGGLGEDWAPLGHERLSQVTLTTEELPDRWYGLTPFSTIVWITGEPSQLGTDRAGALKEWILRGGHLVIAMPPAGQTWTARGTHELFDILPVVRIGRREGVSYEEFRALLTDSATLALPTQGVVHTFEPLPEATPDQAVRVLEGADGSCIVARRLIGTGAVTLIGLDINSIAMRSQAIPQPERFWHRVLGLRGPKPTATELATLANATSQIRQRTAVWVDDDVLGMISKKGTAAAGVLLGFVVFVLYWIAAGPVGYAGLKRLGYHQHAWLSFVGVGVIFTAIAWGGATLLRPREVSATHLTLLDHVYGQPVQRARSWLSVLLPEYGRASVSISDGEPLASGASYRHTLTPWEPRASDFGLGRSFPDASAYAIEARAPWVISVPSRSTVKQFQADWVGGPRWGMPRPLAPDGGAPEEARLTLSGARTASGRLMHDLPGALEQVVIIVVSGQRPLLTVGAPAGPRYMIADASAFRLTDAWEPGRPLDLAAVTSTEARVDVSAESFFGDLLKNQIIATGLRDSPEAINQRMLAQAFFTMLEPPDFRGSQAIPSGTVELGRRGFTHGWDLGRWFTQPCIIVVGQLGATSRDGATPLPLMVDSEKIEATGRTVVRWVYPLPDRPARVEPPRADEPGGV